jgi:hypothetical protein
MKYIITEEQLKTTIKKFNKINFDSGQFGKIIEELVLNFFKSPVCDVAAIKIPELDEYIVLVLTPTYHSNQTEHKLANYIKNFIGVKLTVLLNQSDNCTENIVEQQYGKLLEMIKLDINVGDTIMGGKFKNKKVVVKTIGKNDKGDITINGKPLLRFRILKENNIHLKRREYIMKKKLELKFTPFEHFRLHISDYVGTEMANELNLTGDKKVTFRNQIIQYVRNNLYEYLKEIWESKQN